VAVLSNLLSVSPKDPLAMHDSIFAAEVMTACEGPKLKVDGAFRRRIVFAESGVLKTYWP
jgi:hypothetical protein